MKKSKIAVVIGIAAVVTAVSSVGAITISAHLNNGEPPTVQDEAVSGYVQSYVPTEKDAIRSKELSEKKSKLYQEMIANGKDSKDAAFDSGE